MALRTNSSQKRSANVVKLFAAVNFLLIFVISWRVCHWQALPSMCNVFVYCKSLPNLTTFLCSTLGQAHSLNHKHQTWLVHSRVASQSYPQTLELAGKAHRVQTLQLIKNISKVRQKMACYHYAKIVNSALRRTVI